MIRFFRLVIFSLSTAFLLCTAVSAPAMAQDYAKGLAAWEAYDFVTASQEWLPLAQQGDAEAQNRMGYMYGYGFGVIQDDTQSMGWYRKAAKQGHIEAQMTLALIYGGSDVVPENDAESTKWYRRASEQGSGEAQYMLGLYYVDGVGVSVDFVLGHMWLNISGANGSAFGNNHRDWLAEEMTLEQIAEAQALARRCMSSNYQDCG
jgi:TPR repeat protein